MYSFWTTVVLNLISTRCKSFNELSLQHFDGTAIFGFAVVLVETTNVRCNTKVSTNITISSNQNTWVLTMFILLRRLGRFYHCRHSSAVIAKILPIHLSATLSTLGLNQFNNYMNFDFFVFLLSPYAVDCEHHDANSFYSIILNSFQIGWKCDVNKFEKYIPAQETTKE